MMIKNVKQKPFCTFCTDWWRWQFRYFEHKLATSQKSFNLTSNSTNTSPKNTISLLRTLWSCVKRDLFFEKLVLWSWRNCKAIGRNSVDRRLRRKSPECGNIFW